MEGEPDDPTAPRPLGVLALLEHGPASAAEIASRVGVTRQHAHRLLRPLMTHGFVEKLLDGERPTYRLKRRSRGRASQGQKRGPSKGEV